MSIDIKEPKELFLMRKTFSLFNAFKRFDTLLEIEKEKSPYNNENVKNLDLQRYKTMAKLELQLRALQSELRGYNPHSEDESE